MKKIGVNEVRVIPGDVFGFCVYGEPSERISNWANSWGFRLSKSGDYTNILVPFNFDITECFEKFKQFKYIDGFTYNLDKEINIGQLHNFIITKSLLNMGTAEKSISVIRDNKALGEELESESKKISDFFDLMSFDYDEVIYTSDLKINDNLRPGDNLAFLNKDRALLEHLNASCLHVAGYNHDFHYGLLKIYFPYIHHLSVGLSSFGAFEGFRTKRNEINAQDFVYELMAELDGNLNLAYNVIAGVVLNKKVKRDSSLHNSLSVNSLNGSPGMYLSYTLARLNSIGVKSEPTEKFNRTELQFSYIRSLHKLEPSILLKSIVGHCKIINRLYTKHRIEGSLENEIMFSNLKEDLELGMKSLGMFLIDKV